MGLARQWFSLKSVELPQTSLRQSTMQEAPSTRPLYECILELFSDLKEMPFQRSVAFLQDLMDRGKAFSTIKVYVAAVSAMLVLWGKQGFMRRAARHKLPVSKPHGTSL